MIDFCTISLSQIGVGISRGERPSEILVLILSHEMLQKSIKLRVPCYSILELLLSNSLNSTADQIDEIAINFTSNKSL